MPIHILVSYYNDFLSAYSAFIITNIVIMFVVSTKIRLGYVKIPHGRFLIRGITFAMVVNALDLFWKWVDDGPLVLTRYSALWLNTLYFVILHFMYFYVFLYFYAAVTNTHLTDKKIFMMLIPTLMTVTLNLVNVKYHMLFDITPDGKYVRESFYMLEYVVPYTYLLIPYIKSIMIIRNAHKDKEPVKKINRDILTAPATIGIMGTIGMFNDAIPFLSIALTCTTTFVYMDMVEDYVTVDPISALPNKPEFIDELKHRISIENLKHRDNLYVVVVDILHLRHINDKYGYSEGDNVIRRVSTILRRRTALTEKMNMFACRYAGAQFFLILNADRCEDIMSFCTNLQMKINNSNTINLVDYDIDVMYGFCKYKPDMHVGDIIDMAMNSLDVNKLKYSHLKEHRSDVMDIKET